MQADIDELESMVAELLVYARLERPTDDMVPQETVDARDWLGDVLAQVDHLAQARAVRCVVHGDCPPQARLHRRYMSRALLNLVQNAVRYASRLVHVSLAARADGAELIVDDDGGHTGQGPRQDLRTLHPPGREPRPRHRRPGLGWPLSSAWRPRIMATSACMAALGGARFILRWPRPRRGAPNRSAPPDMRCPIRRPGRSPQPTDPGRSRGRPFRLGGGLHDVARAAPENGCHNWRRNPSWIRPLMPISTGGRRSRG